MKATFTTIVTKDDKVNATGLPVPAEAVAAMGAGKKPKVLVSLNGYTYRASRIMANVAAFYEGEADKPARQAWVDDFAAALSQDDRGAYVGFLGDEGPRRVRDAYPGATWEPSKAVTIRATCPAATRILCRRMLRAVRS